MAPRGARERWGAPAGSPSEALGEHAPPEQQLGQGVIEVVEDAAAEDKGREDQHQDGDEQDGLPVAVQLREQLRVATSEQGAEDVVAVQPRDRQDVDDGEQDVEVKGHQDQREQWRIQPDNAGGQQELQGYREGNRDQQAGHRTGQPDEGGIETAAHPIRIEAQRAAPAEVDEKGYQRAERIEVMTGIEREATVEPGRLIATSDGDRGVCQLVRHQAQRQGRHEIDRVDDELLRITEQHGTRKYRRKTKGPGMLRALYERMKPSGSGSDGFGTHPDGHGRSGRLFGVDRALAAQDATLIDDQRADDDVAEHLAGGEDLEAAGGVDIALDGAADHDVAAGDIAFDVAVLADGEVAFGRQVAEHFAIEADVGRGVQPALKLDLVAQHRLGGYRSGCLTRGSLLEHENLLASC